MTAATPSAAPPRTGKVSPFAWSIRRELWEHRSIYLAPAAIAAVVFVAFLVSTIGMPGRRLQTLRLDLAHQSMIMGEPYAFACAAILGASMLVAWFYCLGAMFNERRDRSILFWKSLPVSDLTSTLAKAAVPLVVLPLITFVLVAASEGVMLLSSTMILIAGGVSPAIPWTAGSISQEGVLLVYELVTAALWQAPVFGWFLLISAWAKRSPFLWAVLPPLAICLVERIAFGTTHLLGLLTDRLFGSEHHALVNGAGIQFNTKGAIPPTGLAAIDLEKFVSTPGLWVGLAIAAALFAVAVWMRRRADPI